MNRAAAEAGDWDIAHIIDGDILADPKGVRQAVDLAHQRGMAVVAHNERLMLSKTGTLRVMGGYRGPWTEKGMVTTTWFDSVSCSVAVPRALWDRVGGFDERFVGWGYEDTAFVIACETYTDQLLMRVNSQCWHLHHSSNADAAKKSPSRQRNFDLCERYRATRFDVAAMDRLIAERAAPDLAPARIPRVLHRTVPAETTDEVEQWWRDFGRLHPGWDLRTHRDPLDPADWPLTADLWPRCQNGAQLAGLIRLEALVTHGGVYVDSDVEPVRSLEPLLQVAAFAGWEDETTVPDAVLACEPGHAAFRLCLEKARRVMEGGGDAWQSGPGVTTEVLPNRLDVLLLPPGAFYPHHYLQKGKATDAPGPWVFARHHWHHSWGTPEQRASIDKRQRS